MISEVFSEENSFFRQLDPGVRLVSAAAFAFVTALLKQFSALSAAFLLAIVLISVSGQRLGTVVRRLAVVNSLILLFWVLLPLTYPGEALFHVWSLPVSRAGVILAAQMTLKSDSVLLVFIALIAPMPINTLGYAMERLRLPRKMTYLLLLTYRYVFVIEQEYDKLVRAAKIRGFSPKTNLHTYKTIAWLIGMLFVRASARADRVLKAMKCRGFDGRFYSLRRFRISRTDRICALLMGSVIIFLMVLEWGLSWTII